MPLWFVARKASHEFSVSLSDRCGDLESKPECSEDHWCKVWLGSSVSSLTFSECAEYRGRVSLSLGSEETQL